MCEQLAGIVSNEFDFRSGFRLPIGVPPPDAVVRDQLGNTLVYNGTLVTMALDCSTSCSVDSLYPPPPGQRWYQFRSTQLLTPAAGDDTLHFRIAFRFQDAAPSSQNLGSVTSSVCQALEGQMVASWLTDDRDDRYSSTVTDLFNEGLFITIVPTLTEIGYVVLVLLILLLGAAKLGKHRARTAANRRYGQHL